MNTAWICRRSCGQVTESGPRTSEPTVSVHLVSEKILTCYTVSLRNFCNIQDPEQLKAETARFEDMILAEGARLKSIGQKGLEILPGVKELLASVSRDLETQRPS